VLTTAPKTIAALTTGVLASGAASFAVGFSTAPSLLSVQSATSPADRIVGRPSASRAVAAPWWITHRNTETGVREISAPSGRDLVGPAASTVIDAGTTRTGAGESGTVLAVGSAHCAVRLAASA